MIIFHQREKHNFQIGYANMFEHKAFQFEVISPNDACLSAKKQSDLYNYILLPLIIFIPIISWLSVERETYWQNNDYESLKSEFLQYKYLHDMYEVLVIDRCPFCLVSVQFWLIVLAALILTSVLLQGV